jgi:putative SOS response-associated peptidase YedK
VAVGDDSISTPLASAHPCGADQGIVAVAQLYTRHAVRPPKDDGHVGGTCGRIGSQSSPRRGPHGCAAVLCGRYTNTRAPEEIDEQLGVPIRTEPRTRRFNIAPHGEPEARLLRWWLVPPWAKDLKGAYKMINARMEKVSSKPAYRSVIATGSRRALQIADGYFEWLKPEKRGEPRQPFFLQVDGGQLFAFAAPWTPAKIKDKWIGSIVTLTCDSSPNRVAAAIHDRIPVILADRGH